MKLVLKQENYQEFTGLFGFVQFENGVSVDEVSRKDAKLIASAIHAEWEDGSSANPAAVFTEALQARPVEVAGEEHITPREPVAPATPVVEVVVPVVDPVIEPVVTPVETPAPVEQVTPAETPAEEASATPAEVPVVLPESHTGHTEAQLAAIADKDGIRGLRAIAAPLGIKGTSIAELITEIMNYKPE